MKDLNLYMKCDIIFSFAGGIGGRRFYKADTERKDIYGFSYYIQIALPGCGWGAWNILQRKIRGHPESTRA